MPRYIPSDVQTDMQTIAYVRQNCNKKNKDPLDTVLRANTIHIPWGHVKQDIIDYEQDPQAFCSSNIYANTCISLPIGSIVLIPDGKKGLIVRLTSDVKSGVMRSLCTAVTPRNCGHPVVRGRHRCIECHNSVQENFNPSDLQKISAHLNNGCNIEPFWSLYRDVEIIGDADYNGVDGRSMAGLDSVGKWSRYWRLVA